MAIRRVVSTDEPTCAAPRHCPYCVVVVLRRTPLRPPPPPCGASTQTTRDTRRTSGGNHECPAARAPTSAGRGRHGCGYPVRICMQLQECGSCGTGAPVDVAGARRIDDPEQQAHHQVTPEQAGELLGHVRRPSVE